ncbi:MULTISPECIES: hypothetical protein [unclassified Rhizobium]|uniref:hypothetical protein n=1 Tax=unclassified Rhizobium TaxID=2613769 RepID=UPI001FE196F5|nr:MULTISPECIES: hypothetical protein [unclassified Rhizobium]
MNHFDAWLSEARDEFYVAVNADLLGFVSVKGAEVVKLYVGRNARGQGVADSLLSFAELKLSKKWRAGSRAVLYSRQRPC